jgi:hypothetical protein
MPRFRCEVCESEFGSDEKLADHYSIHLQNEAIANQ